MSIKFKPIYTRYLQFKVFAMILFVRVPYLVVLSFQGECLVGELYRSTEKLGLFNKIILTAV